MGMGIGALGCGCCGGSSGLPCNPCNIPEQNLAYTLAVYNGGFQPSVSGTITYNSAIPDWTTSPFPWTTGASQEITVTLACTGGTISVVIKLYPQGTIIGSTISGSISLSSYTCGAGFQLNLVSVSGAFPFYPGSTLVITL
jgi:hypothetical protein